jgi:predicted PurR-regulated permease PerM
MMFDKPFDFNRFVRLLLGIAAVVGVYLLLDSLSAVLIPFFLAWLVAYLLEPLVRLAQRLVKKRIPAVVLTLVAIGAAFTGFLALFIPLLVDELSTLQRLLSAQLNNLHWPAWIPKDTASAMDEFLSGLRIEDVMQHDGVADQAVGALSGVWDVLTGVFGALGALFGVVTFMLYLAFIMIDYDVISKGWRNLVPEKYSKVVNMLMEDMEEGMNGYFKAMTKIVIVVAFLFAIGFKLIGLPFAIVLGITLGIMNYIPYSQLIGIVPAVGLTALHSLETGENFWFMLLLVLVVFTVVQLAQDLFLTPKFMGDFSGFNPAIILLSLSIWGSLLGMIGVIIAIPLTSILLAYYKRYILDRKK